METWYLIIILISPYQNQEARMEHIAFANEDACIILMETLTEKYDRPENTIICVKDR